MWGRNINELPPIHTPTRDQTRNLGMCPDGESNLQLFGVLCGTALQPTEPPGQGF